MADLELKILQDVLSRLNKPSPAVYIGPGDDCAALDIIGSDELFLIASDQLIGDVHFFFDKTDPALAGAKLLKRNLSDIAAMGGVATFALLNFAANGLDESYIKSFYNGIMDSAEDYGVEMIGGDFASLAKTEERSLCASLTICGRVTKALVKTRSAAKVGDFVYVTGALGNSLISEHHLTFSPRMEEGRFLAQYANAMMDITDSLALDACRMSASSGVAIELNLSSLPLRSGATVEMALHDGEDYELLFTVSPEKENLMLSKYNGNLAKLSRIGVVRSGSGLFDSAKNPLNEGKIGYVH